MSKNTVYGIVVKLDSDQNPRELRGRAIAENGNQIKRVNPLAYTVKSQNGNGAYSILKDGSEWRCTCPDHVHRNVKCKHIWAVEFSLALREKVASRIVLAPVQIHACPICESEQIAKRGVRHNKSGDIQRYICESCGRWFVVNFGFERMKASPQAITSAMQLYFTGESLRNVQNFLRLQGVNVSHVTVYKWIGKYTRLMQKLLEQIRPQVSDTWRADELYLKVKGDMKYLYAMMDDETRFWIAQEVADTKHNYDARRLFHKAKQAIGRRPKTLITDGLRTYHEAYLKEFYTMRKEGRTKHIRHITIRGDRNNNKMERLNGEIRDREKVMRGLKKPETPIIPGYQIYHNYIRPHEALDGKTPAEACGIEVQGENKWLTLIQNASQKH
jgi:transposase-like protein